MFTHEDLSFLASKNISKEQVLQQLESFRKGFPYLKLKEIASTDFGILRIEEADAVKYETIWKRYCQENKQILKFVPASGAASRMFKDLFEFLDADRNAPETAFEVKFFNEIAKFAFFQDLNEICVHNEGEGIAALMAKGEFKKVVDNLLSERGLNYGKLPKGLLKFHATAEGARTAMEEHLVEGAMYAANAKGAVNLHFTVSPEHQVLFEQLVTECVAAYEKRFGVKYQITFSVQKSSTDTIAADAENQPFRENGQLLFRPGGHGALIENLNEQDADIVFIKNIDNVVPDRLKEVTVKYKQIIAGVLADLQAQSFRCLALLESDDYTHQTLLEMLDFVECKLFAKCHGTPSMSTEQLAACLKEKLNRPIRVCGMVKNIGEPGGGPFVVFNNDGSHSLQILESSQIDLSNAEAEKMFQSSTHFNPVDLVCATRNYKGEKYDLLRFVDPSTGFISIKSKSGKELKALELPGLWNGAMANWNTIFVEVPLETFNPVKTVNDLLRYEHQA